MYVKLAFPRMWIGARLEEERRRLGLSIADFSRAVGAHRNSQKNYESGHRVPDASYLAAATAVGADLVYLVLGNRHAQRRTAEQLISVSDARARIHKARAAVELGREDELPALKDELELLSSAPELPDRLRAQADMLLVQACDDAGARERQEWRFQRQGERVREAYRAVDSAARLCGWKPPTAIYESLATLASQYSISDVDLEPVMQAVHAVIAPD
jgi:transcriptional regulator with XRE-family HTH domain